MTSVTCFGGVNFSLWQAVKNITKRSKQEKNENPKNRPRARPNSDTKDVKSYRYTSFSLKIFCFYQIQVEIHHIQEVS